MNDRTMGGAAPPGAAPRGQTGSRGWLRGEESPDPAAMLMSANMPAAPMPASAQSKPPEGPRTATTGEAALISPMIRFTICWTSGDSTSLRSESV